MTSCNRTLAGSSRHPGHIDQGTLARHHSRSRSITGSPRCAPAPVRINALIFDEEFVTRFLSSVAHAIVLERNTKVTWVEYRDSKVLNGIYAAMGALLNVGSPGWAEVDSGDVDRINAQKAEMEMRLFESFVNAMIKGPSRVMHFLNSQDETRSRTLESVHSIYREVTQINQAVADEARRGVARLSLIKCASTLAVKTIALRAGGMPSFLIGSGYDIALNVIDNWDKGDSALAVGVASKAFDKGWKKAVKDTAKNAANIYKGEAEGPAARAEWLAKRLEQIDAELNQKGITERSAKYLKDARKLARAESAAASAQRAATALSAVKYGFFAWDLYKTLDRAADDLHAAGYESSWAGVSDAMPEFLR